MRPTGTSTLIVESRLTPGRPGSRAGAPRPRPSRRSGDPGCRRACRPRSARHGPCSQAPAAATLGERRSGVRVHDRPEHAGEHVSGTGRRQPPRSRFDGDDGSVGVGDQRPRAPLSSTVPPIFAATCRAASPDRRLRCRGGCTRRRSCQPAELPCVRGDEERRPRCPGRRSRAPASMTTGTAPARISRSAMLSASGAVHRIRPGADHPGSDARTADVRVPRRSRVGRASTASATRSAPTYRTNPAPDRQAASTPSTAAPG